VKLRSGGYIVMNPTEALISIDVNSGRSTGERNIEETAIKTNIEAAQEIARQLRLRDLAGLIVIDFIDMMDGKNRRNVERVLKDALRSDRAKIQIGRISPFGLLEMSRQRLRPSIAESVSKACDHCNGTGVVRTDAAVAIQLIRSIEKEAGQQLNIERFKVFLTPAVAVYLLNHMRDTLHKLEQDYAVEVEVQIDPALHEGNFRMEKIRCKDKEKQRQKEQLQQRKPITMEATEEEMASADAMEAEMAAEENDAAENEITVLENNDRPERRDRDRRRRGGRGRDRDREAPNKSAEAEAKSSEETADSTAGAPKDAVEKKERSRGRGRDRNHQRDPKPESAPAAEVAALTKARTETVTAIANSIEYKSATALSEKAPAIPLVSPVAGSAPIKPKATPDLAVLADPKPQKPARKGWWQKIME
jgi:ribonuclease E